AAGTAEVKISEHCSSKTTNTFGEFELEGIYRLQDQASPSDSEARAEEDSATGTFGLRSRKRVFTDLSPEQLESQHAKRSCTEEQSLDLTASSTEEGDRSKSGLESVLPEKLGAALLITPERQSRAGDDDVFLLSGSTPPVKSSLSASSLRALTQSPLLCPGQTPQPRRRHAPEEESNGLQPAATQELSPLHLVASRKRPLSRTYSRKKLLR
ncbi:TICRR protein, partial [Psilopogon haemacephalus]|nr:TICRR protein [Psilopogon haemacephalus]